MCRAVVEIPDDDPNFWKIVTKRVKTRSHEECEAYYYKVIHQSLNTKKTVTTTGKLFTMLQRKLLLLQVSCLPSYKENCYHYR